MSSNKNKQQNSSEVVAPSDENTQMPVVEQAPTEADVNPITVKIASLSPEQQAKIAHFQENKKMFVSNKVETVAFKAFTQDVDLYETSVPTEQIEAEKTQFDVSIKALLGTGLTEDHLLVVQFKKGYGKTIETLEKEVKDNLPELAAYFGVVLSRVQGSRVYASTGQLSAKKMSEAEIKARDFYYSEHDKKAIVIHSQTIAETALTKLGIKSASDTWVAFEYNGQLQVNRLKDPETNWHYAELTNVPESWVKVHPVVSTTGSLSGLVGVVAATLGNKYSGNGWQGNAYLSSKFDKVMRVVKVNS